MGEEKSEAKVKPCFAILHGILCFLIGAGGAALLGYSIYLQVTQPNLLPDLNLGGNAFLNTLLSTAIAGMIVGACMIVIAIIGGIASKRGCCGITFAIIYTVIMIALLAILIFIAVVSLKFATDSQGETITETARDIWVNSVTNPEYVDAACAVQDEFNCMGFDKGDCDGSNPDSEVCPVCTPAQTETGLQGCYEAVVDYYDQYYEPIGIISSVFAGVVFIDLVIVWVL